MTNHSVLRLAGRTRAGVAGTESQDAFCLAPARGLVAVMDGIGRNRLGIQAVLDVLQAVAHDRSVPSPAELVAVANERVRAAAADETDSLGVGCSLLVATWAGQQMQIAHAGDVRAYRIRQNQTTLLTHDHSTAAELARRGHISPQAVRRHHLRHRLVQGVGRSETIVPEVVLVDLEPGDRLVLCTDGVWSVLLDEEIGLLASKGYDPQHIVRRLLEAAERADSQDDATVVVMLAEELGEWVRAVVPSRYALRACLGRGSFAAVYGGLDTQLRREVAVKLLYPDCLGERTRQRLQREAHVLAQVDHPNVVALHDALVEGDTPYLVMQYVPGETLAALLPRLTIAESLSIVRQVAGALAAVHSRGVVHRDLKPANIIVMPDGLVKVVDFGIARVPPQFDQLGVLTTHRRVGNEAYMAPEQYRGEGVDGRADLYSLGVILYEMLTGDLPGVVAVAREGASPPPPPSTYNANVSPGLDTLVERLLAPAPEDRYASAEQVVEALDRLAEGYAPRPPAGLAGVAPPPPEEELAAVCQQLQSVLATAQAEAADLAAGYIGTEHLFLALLRPGGAAAALLGELAQEASVVTAAIRAYVGPGSGLHSEGFPLTPRAGRVLVLAGQIARDCGEPVEAVHLLQAILQEGEGVAARVLRRHGLNPTWLLQQLRGEAAVPLPHLEADAREEEEEEAFAPAGSAGPPLLLRYGRDLTALARDGALGPVIGREDELRQVIYTLMRREKNNPVLTGEAGVGKTAIVEGLAWRIAQGQVPEALRGRSIVELNMGTLVAGTRYRGEFEERLTRLVAEVRDAPGMILFIDEIHTIVGAGETEGGSLDAANILKPALARGELRCIGATTPAEYERHIARDAALERRFRPVHVPEPSADEAVLILRGVRERYERHHGVPIDEAALVAAVHLAVRYLTGRHLPDKALDLLDEAGARVRVRLTESEEGPAAEARVTPEVVRTVLADWLGVPEVTL